MNLRFRLLRRHHRCACVVQDDDTGRGIDTCRNRVRRLGAVCADCLRGHPGEAEPR